MTDVLAMTRKPAILESVEISSSVMPSAKYSSRLSELMLESGRTAMRGPSNVFLAWDVA